jgi:DNA-directed RNA polymerase subunit H (RpoH/RPB5)
MSEVEFNRYRNILTFAGEWRKYEVLSPPLDKESFRKTIQSDQYVRIECSDKRHDRTVLIFLFSEVSKYVASSTDMKKLLAKIKEPFHVILITHQALNVYHRKAIASQKHLHVNVYRHEIFDLILPNGPLCYPHRILSRDEVLKLTNDDLCCYVINLPKILDEDPQCIWIGAEVGDVIEIQMLSDITGETCQYRVVIPKSGKVIAQKPSTQPEDLIPVEEEKEVDEVDEEIQARREEIDDADDVDDDADAPDDAEDRPRSARSTRDADD